MQAGSRFQVRARWRGQPFETARAIVAVVPGQTDQRRPTLDAADASLYLRDIEGAIQELRAVQQRTWMWALIRDQLETRFRRHPGVVAALGRLEAAVQSGTLSSTAAADELLAAFDSRAGIRSSF